MWKDKFGNTITEEESNKLRCNDEYRRIQFNKINNYLVSTVFTGCAYFDEGRIYYFDTGVFKDKKWILNHRTRTLEEAKETHDNYVEKITKGTPDVEL